MVTQKLKTPPRVADRVGMVSMQPQTPHEEAHIAAKLANLGAKAGQHGPLSACTVKLHPRVSRDAALRIAGLARALGIRPATVQQLALDAVSRVSAVEFFAVLAELHKRSR